MKVIEKSQPTFDYHIEDKPKEAAKPTLARKHRQFGEDGYFYFEGTRGELHDFIKASNPELYEKAFVYTINGNTRDWFYSFSADAINIILTKYGFNWEPVYKYITAQDKKEKINQQEVDRAHSNIQAQWNNLYGLVDENFF